MRLMPLLFCLFLCPSVAPGDTLPALVVHNGENLISLTVRNKTRQPVRTLTVTADEKAWPEWIRLSSPLLSLTDNGDVQAVQLPLTVVDAPEGMRGELPLLLTDDRGRTWQARLHVRVSASGITEDALFPNVPNPFNPETTIRYQLSGTKARPTTLVIYNALGQPIRTLVDRVQRPGVYKVRWDGKDDLGRSVASGVYLYRMVSGTFRQTHQMLLLK